MSTTETEVLITENRKPKTRNIFSFLKTKSGNPDPNPPGGSSIIVQRDDEHKANKRGCSLV